jgi:hypothetical protein
VLPVLTVLAGEKLHGLFDDEHVTKKRQKHENIIVQNMMTQAAHF